MTINIRKNSIKNCVDIIVFIFLFIGVQYTADWKGYEAYMAAPEMCPDILFSYIAEKSTYFGWSFLEVYRLHIVFMAILFVLFIRRYTNYCLLTLIFFVLINYVYIANQIRFFLALPLTYFALVLYINKKIINSIFLLMIACFSHQTMILLFLSGIIVSELIDRVGFKKSILLLFAMTLIAGFLWKVAINIDKFSIYQDVWGNVSLLGGMWQSFPIWISLVTIVFVHGKIEKYDHFVLLNVKYKELLVLSLSCMLFLGIGFNIIIFIERFCLPLVMVWLIYFIYVSKKYSFNNVFVIGIVICFVNVMFVYVYPFITGKTYLIDEMMNTILSYNL